jgi:hypothetical protein
MPGTTAVQIADRKTRGEGECATTVGTLAPPGEDNRLVTVLTSVGFLVDQLVALAGQRDDRSGGREALKHDAVHRATPSPHHRDRTRREKLAHWEGRHPDVSRRVSPSLP